LSLAYFIVLEREIPGFENAVNGKALAKSSKQLDSIAKENNLPTLRSFFSISADELTGLADEHGVSLKQRLPSEKWFSADVGLKTVNGLIDAAAREKLDARIIADLQEFKEVLETARRNGVGWHLAVDF